MSTKESILSGTWYPAKAKDCEKKIESYLKEISFNKDPNKTYLGGIVPHAGWAYSGDIACNVINCLKEEIIPDVFVIFGMHLSSNSPCYIISDNAWETPFGDIKIHKEFLNEFIESLSFDVTPLPNHINDNTIELQLPFIKYFFNDVKILPIGVPLNEKAYEIGKKISIISNNLGLKIKVLGSTDLTHYGPNYGYSPKGSDNTAVDWVKNKNDKKIIDLMIDMDAKSIMDEAKKNQNACCAGAAAAAISSGLNFGINKAESIYYKTSFDILPSDSFVGYAGIVF